MGGLEMSFIGKAIGYVTGAHDQAKAAETAATVQGASAQQGIDEQRRQFDLTQANLAPYMQAGTGALNHQLDLAGVNGPDAQAAAVQAIQAGPQFSSMLKQGENSILANASATGGLRGGNTQAALAQFSPQLLAQLVEQQYSRYGGLAGNGQSAASGLGQIGAGAANSISNLYGQQGAATAGGIMANGSQARTGFGDAMSLAALYAVSGGGFGGGGGGGVGTGGSGFKPSAGFKFGPF
jgi:hypothetical protein